MQCWCLKDATCTRPCMQKVISDNREMKSNTGETRPTHDRSDMCWYRHDITQVWQRDLLNGAQLIVLYEARCLQVCSALHCSLHFCLHFSCFYNCSSSPVFQLLCLFALVLTEIRRANCSTGHRKRHSHRHTVGHGNTQKTHTQAHNIILQSPVSKVSMNPINARNCFLLRGRRGSAG